MCDLSQENATTTASSIGCFLAPHPGGMPNFMQKLRLGGSRASDNFLPLIATEVECLLSPKPAAQASILEDSDRLFWVTSSLSISYPARGWFRPLAVTQHARFDMFL